MSIHTGDIPLTASSYLVNSILPHAHTDMGDKC